MIKDDGFLDYMKQQNIKCGFGWFGMIMPILENLRRFNNDNPNEQIKIICFKEKHGTLEINAAGKQSDCFQKDFFKAIKASTVTCEYCGCSGELKKRDDGKEKTLCPRCSRKYKDGKKFIKSTADFFDFLKEQNIHCEYGWYGLILPIIAKLKKWREKHPTEQPDEISSFEENWRTLQIRASGIPAYLEKLVDNARDASKSICEFCGCPGNEYKDSTGWYLTLCPDCVKIREETNKKHRLENIEKEEFNSRSEYGNQYEFLAELSALTRKHEINICAGSECFECPRISVIEHQGYAYKVMEYSNEAGCYTLESYQEENMRDMEGDTG
jgi:hypothetical protein